MKSYTRSMARILPLIASIGVAALLAACGADSTRTSMATSEDREAAPTQAATRPARRGPLVTLRDSQLGPVLFSGSNRAVYTFTRDGSGSQARSRCHGDCAEAWPPFFAKARPRAGSGVKRALLGTIRRGRRRQLTYSGQPLYFYAHDPTGEVLCNDIVEFGGTWFAVTAAGKPPA